MISVFPFVSGNYGTPTDKQLPLFVDVAWDFEKDEPIIKDNDFVLVEGNEAIKVWIYKCIKTNRKEHDIYSWEYGTDLIELIGDKYTKALTEAEAKRYVKERLEKNPYIIEVNVKDSELIDSKLYLTIHCRTIYGEVEVNV
ncbi:DUF2634 domain-containing protein [Metaclostridioides mangenotii]|uniref:DUF2634 domain-containing protein n=1 Tax=Metaclostridioides mangenotii TaxID=1540 RepID=UPI000483F241|nr:DUF2634 domain-containing protein [Clostridioides mangenotii]